MQCFTAVERLNPKNHDWKPAINPSSILLEGLKIKHAFKDYKAYSPLMREGYALFIEERLRSKALAIWPIAIISGHLTGCIKALYDRDPELDELSSVLLDFVLLACCFYVSVRFRLGFALLLTVVRILSLWYLFHYKDIKSDVISISDMFCPIILLLLARYSIKIDWKEVRSLFW